MLVFLKELWFHSKVATMLAAKKKKIKSRNLVLCLFYLLKEFGLMTLILNYTLLLAGGHRQISGQFLSHFHTFPDSVEHSDF